MNAASDDMIKNKLTNNLNRLLLDLGRDYQRRLLGKCAERGHPDVRGAHTTLFSHLGYSALRLSDLAERVGISQQAMGKMVKQLQAIGYIERTIDDNDKRARIITPSAKGRQFLLDYLEIVDELRAEYQQILGEQGLNALLECLQSSSEKLLPQSGHR